MSHIYQINKKNVILAEFVQGIQAKLEEILDGYGLNPSNQQMLPPMADTKETSVNMDQYLTRTSLWPLTQMLSLHAEHCLVGKFLSESTSAKDSEGLKQLLDYSQMNTPMSARYLVSLHLLVEAEDKVGPHFELNCGTA